MTDALFSVQGQVVLVSGGTRGIGRAIAEGFCERGATVVVTGRQEQNALDAAAEITAHAEKQGSKGKCVGLPCDVERPDQIQPCVDRVLADHGRIDTLVNVAGVNRRKPSESITEDDFSTSSWGSISKGRSSCRRRSAGT
jgi:gluconate 5-dehydrogenase